MLVSTLSGPASFCAFQLVGKDKRFIGGLFSFALWAGDEGNAGLLAWLEHIRKTVVVAAQRNSRAACPACFDAAANLIGCFSLHVFFRCFVRALFAFCKMSPLACAIGQSRPVLLCSKKARGQNFAIRNPSPVSFRAQVLK
jgi:hypothetical protein